MGLFPKLSEIFEANGRLVTQYKLYPSVQPEVMLCCRLHSWRQLLSWYIWNLPVTA